MHLGEELLVLGLLLIIAYVLGRLGKLVGLPAIPIYMLVGLIASPHSFFFPLSFESADVELIAVFGLILLLFNLGLEFDQDEFYGNAGRLIVSGGTRIAINFAVGFVLGMWIGWGTREALIIAGMTATSSSAIVTKLLIELRRLANRETPTILGIMVLEDVFIAFYLAIVGVVLGGQTDVWAIVLQLTISFSFLIVMFALARWGGRFVSRLVQTKDDELFTILFFGLAVAFGGIGELLGVSDAIGAFLIGLVLGATRFRGRIEQLALPLRDVFGAFFFLSFGLALDVSTFGGVLVPAMVAVGITLVINTAGGQLIAWQNGLTRREGLNASAMLQNRGEFALILATLAVGAGLDPRLTPFAGLYVLTMAVVGPILAVNSERIGRLIFPARTAPVAPERDRMREEGIALVEAATAGQVASEPNEELDAAVQDAVEQINEQAAQQSDEIGERRRDPEYSSFWTVARRPQWIAALILALAIAGGFAALGQWQLSRSIEGGADTVVTEAVVPLSAVAEPQQPVFDEGYRLVSTDTEFVPGDYIVLSDRLDIAGPGYWVVGHALVPGGASLAVALGWTGSADAAASAIATLEHDAPASIEGRYLPSQAPTESDFEAGQRSALAVPELINLWADAPEGVFGGYLIAGEPVAGLQAIDAPAPSSEVSLNLLNIFYAVEWVVFAGFAVFLWYRLVRDVVEAEAEASGNVD